MHYCCGADLQALCCCRGSLAGGGLDPAAAYAARLSSSQWQQLLVRSFSVCSPCYPSCLACLPAPTRTGHCRRPRCAAAAAHAAHIHGRLRDGSCIAHVRLLSPCCRHALARHAWGDMHGVNMLLRTVNLLNALPTRLDATIICSSCGIYKAIIYMQQRRAQRTTLKPCLFLITLWLVTVFASMLADMVLSALLVHTSGRQGAALACDDMASAVMYYVLGGLGRSLLAQQCSEAHSVPLLAVQVL